MDLPRAGRIAGLYRHPVKGFTPEPLDSASLAPGAAFPDDRIFAVENGPSGFDPAAPDFIPKQKFAVLAAFADVARARTRYDSATGVLTATAEGMKPIAAALAEPAGRQDFAAWLTDLLGDGVRGPLQVVQAPGHRFLDHPQGHVSVLNLASVRDLEARIGRPVDPRRFRANILVEGWPAWIELEEGAVDFAFGPARATLFKPIIRCVATHVDPDTAERDIEIVRALFEHYGHRHCGVYVHVTTGGRIAPGDAAVLG